MSPTLQLCRHARGRIGADSQELIRRGQIEPWVQGESKTWPSKLAKLYLRYDSTFHPYPLEPLFFLSSTSLHAVERRSGDYQRPKAILAGFRLIYQSLVPLKRMRRNASRTSPPRHASMTSKPKSQPKACGSNNSRPPSPQHARQPMSEAKTMDKARAAMPTTTRRAAMPAAVVTMAATVTVVVVVAMVTTAATMTRTGTTAMTMGPPAVVKVEGRSKRTKRMVRKPKRRKRVSNSQTTTPRMRSKMRTAYSPRKKRPQTNLSTTVLPKRMNRKSSPRLTNLTGLRQRTGGTPTAPTTPQCGLE